MLNLIEMARVPPNGLAFSCRERATTSLQKANDLVRGAVGCNANPLGSSGHVCQLIEATGISVEVDEVALPRAK
jgi:hypothetical protein